MKQIECDPQLIESFLSDQLDTEQEAAFELHLDQCDSCCESLSRQSADEQSWCDVRSYLELDLSTVDSESALVTITLDFLSASDDPRMLGRFGGYEIAGVVGQGGMGIVLKGFDQALNRYAAIKVLAPHYASSGAARKRFEREAQAAAAVVHDNVIAIHGVDQCSNLPFLVMPYVRGESLQRRIDRVGSLSVVEVLRISMQTALGLAAAHEQGLVHRDIKPANILLPDGVERVLITDFGLARAADDASLTRSGVIAGTPQYMSPEQARGEAIGTQSDLFSLGSMMYGMCAGRLPFRAETPYGILRRITDSEPTPIQQINPEIPLWLCRLIAKLHQKQPEHRFESAAQLAELLRGALVHVQTPSEPLPVELRGDRRSSFWWVKIAACLLIFFGGLFWWSESGTHAADRTHAADQGTTLKSANLPTGDLSESNSAILENVAPKIHEGSTSLSVHDDWDLPEEISPEQLERMTRQLANEIQATNETFAPTNQEARQ